MPMKMMSGESLARQKLNSRTAKVANYHDYVIYGMRYNRIITGQGHLLIGESGSLGEHYLEQFEQ